MLLTALLLFLTVGDFASARPGFPSPVLPPTLQARSAILVEARTGAVLYQQRADDAVPPASLTKLMTLHLALEHIRSGRLDPEEIIVPAPEAWAQNMPVRSSVMFLGPRQRVSIEQLLKGLVVDSGNDAAVQLARHIAGSVPAFVRLMNEEAVRLGYPTMRFVDPSGISWMNRISAREYAEFSRLFVRQHPDALRDLCSLRQFTYPLPENRAAGNRERSITQFNPNVLLGRYEGVDGLKTGYIDEAGYNMAVTAERDGVRLIAVVLGIPRRGAGGVSGARLRLMESARMLDYGYDNFTPVRPVLAEVPPSRVWKGRARTVALAPEQDPFVMVRRDQAADVRCRLRLEHTVVAPVKRGQVLGEYVVTVGSEEVGRIPLRAAQDVLAAGFVRSALDGIFLLIKTKNPRVSGVSPRT